jgi:hypothetical protein
MRYLFLFLMLACASLASAATIYQSIYQCEGGREGSGETSAAYEGFLCTKQIKAMPDSQAINSNRGTQTTYVITSQLEGIKDRIEQLRSSVDFKDVMTRAQLTKERDSLTRELQASSEIDHWGPQLDEGDVPSGK